ncbi:MAG: class II aldolase/adducin family protein, partial [Myxococcota bacterium]
MSRTAGDRAENRWSAEKREVASIARDMASLGLVSGSSGNVSLKLGDRDSSDEPFAVTPFGTPCAGLGDDDIVVVNRDGEPVEDDQVPSSETLLHLAVYRARPDVGAVMHTHSVFATVAAVAGL